LYETASWLKLLSFMMQLSYSGFQQKINISVCNI
jgi:hypothetical protein